MAFQPFPEEQYVRTIDSNSEIDGGYFTVDTAIELQHIMMRVFIRGVLAGTEEIRLNIYANNTLANPIWSSSWFDLSEKIGSYTTNWIGNIVLDFGGAPLNPNVTYYIGVETQNYTRNGDSFYISAVLDWYDDLNEQVSSSAGIRMGIIGLR